jgi:hypothetical protein
MVELLHLKVTPDIRGNTYDNEDRNRGWRRSQCVTVELKCVKDNGICQVNYEDEHLSYFL